MSSLRAGLVALALVLLGGQALFAAGASAGPCDSPLNEIVCENSKAGNPASEWDVSGAGDSSIQGFATDISVDQGQTVHFKVNTPSSDYRLDIYRMGYYDGKGARKVATVQPSASLPQGQPGCKTESSTGLVDCGNWQESASWAVPASAVSGIYFAKLQREDQASEGSHVLFVIRDDDGHSDLLFQTSDTTWQAYNRYGGNSLYVGGPGANPGRAYKVSYNRPLTVRGPVPEDSPFNAEYPMVRWLERNGYDISYTTDVDSDRRGAEILEHGAFLSVGHDEYWSAEQRANVEAARDAGVNLAFFSGNEVFWKTRWENSIDGSGTSYRTLVSYKETHANANLDPDPDTWTGTWRDPRFSPPADGGRPENELTGTLFAANSGDAAIEVPAADGKLRLWRNTSVASQAPGQTATLAEDTLGYEWDEAPEGAFQPAGLVRLSNTTASVPQKLLDYGNTYGPGPVTHSLTLYRVPSDALVFGAGTIQWSWGLDGEHDRGGPDPDPRMQQATVNLLADMGAQPGSIQGDMLPAIGTTDEDPPSASIAVPAESATVEANQALTISGTATDIEGESGLGGRVGAVEVSVDGGTTWHLAKGRGNWTYSWTPSKLGKATIVARAVDDSGNLETPGDQVGVEVAAQACPCSIWENALTGNQDADQNAIEVGVKFRSDVAGFVTGLRFYKTAGNTGTHVGRLWTTGGTQLGQATFAGETPTGWQQTSFDTPVAISANTTYIAAYHAPAGHYASIGGYFKLAGFDNAPLHAPADGASGPNGIYKYGAAGGLFTGGAPNTFNSENYLVDLVFEKEVKPDTSSPLVGNLSPVEDATEVSADVSVSATFNEAMNAATIGGATVKLRDTSGAAVTAVVSYNPAQRQVTLDPDAPLQLGTTYTATLKGGVGGIADTAGNTLAGDEAWSFTTAPPPPPPPDEGPGGPILVISNGSNPFSRYYTEVLRAEGLNQFTATDITKVTPGVLASRDVAILGEGALSAVQAQMLSNWVQQGGNLIAMRPDSDLAGLLGLTPAGGVLGNGYLQVDTGSAPGAGIVGQTIQFHGTADRYTLTGGAQAIATLYSSASTSTSNPAVTLRSVGSSGGEAAAFTYDLARSIVYTRQGNPAWAGQERDGASPIRSDDLFFGAAAGDPQPDWVDLNKVAIPQADEQQRLLTNLIGEMNLDRKPLPRFWFLPRDEKAAVVMTGDDHAGGGTGPRFNHFKTLDPPGCVVADWGCVRSTSYIYPNSPITDQESAAFTAEGFEVGLHPQTNCKNWTSKGQLESVFSSQLAALAASHPSLPAPATNRMHCIVWSDWASLPEVELQNGVRLDTTYYYWPEAWVKNRPGMFTGSGMPMRFAKTDGSMIDVYQAATQMTDESGQAFPFTADKLLDGALGLDGYYGVFVANMHTDANESPGANAIVASAQARGVPVVSARQMLTWLDGRNQSSFGSVQWVGNELGFTINHAAGANGLRAMLPTTSAIGPLDAIEKGGAPVTTTTQTIKGVEYAFFDAASGSYTAIYVDESHPLISNVQVAAGNDGTATVTWNTNEPADSRVDYGTSPSSLTLNASNPALVTSHSVQLSGLDLNATYHFRVTSADGEAHATVKPSPPLAPQSFPTPPPAPQLSATVPASPANQNSPKVVGSATSGSTVHLYAGANCLGAPLATATVAQLAAGVTVSVADNSTSSFRATATSTAGTSVCSAPLAYVEDSAPPDTQITAQPAALVNSAVATFSFTGNDPGGSGVASFQCRLDSEAPGAWASCATGQQYTGLSEGSHKFEARAIDAAGNIDGSPATYTWTVDTKAPNTQITANPASPTKNTTATFSFSGDDAGGSGVASFQCRLDSEAPGAWASCAIGQQYTGLSEGSHKFEVRAIDQAANADSTPATHQWQIDLSAPQVTIDPPAKALLKAGESTDLSWHADENGTFQLRLGGADCDAGTVIDSGSYGTSPAAKLSNVAAAQLQEGANTLRLCLTDAAGNRGQATTALNKDTGPPNTQITNQPTALVNVATASFSFTGDDVGGSGIASFQCRLDSGAPEAWEACTSAKQYSGLGEGSHAFEVRAIDQAGNPDASPATYTWTVDTKAPETSIDSGPPAFSGSATANFAFHGEDPGGSGGISLQCRRDSTEPEDWQPCTSPLKNTSLAEGPHTFEVRATDQAGNIDGSPATYTWTVDTKAPETQITDKPAGLVNVTTVSFSFGGDDTGGSGVASFQCRLDSGAPEAWEACTSAKQYSGLGEGSHKFEVRAVDQAGSPDASPATYTWTVDAKAPETLITDKPAALVNATTASFSFTGDDTGGSGMASFQCRLDSNSPGAWEGCASAKQYVDLADGPHKFEVRAIDVAGNIDATPATHLWSIDTKAPETQITDKPAGLVNVTTVSFSFTGDDSDGSGVASFQCRLDSEAPGAWEACTSAKQYSGLGEGSHKFEVRAVDQAGSPDATPASYQWQIDLTPPSVSVDSGPTGLTNDSTPTFGFSSEPGASFECSIDTGTPSFGSCSAASSHTPASPLSDGPHTFRVRATEQAGNQATATRSFTVDATEPTTQIADQPAALVNVATASFSFTGDDTGGSGVASFQCRIDSEAPGAWEACTSAKQYSGLGEGSHKFEVRALDNAGNADGSPASYTWAVDTKAPETLIDTAPPAISNNATANFGFHGEDVGGSGVQSLQCRRDSAEPEDWESCGSPRKYTLLAEGAHKFEVRAIDVAGNIDATPATHLWSIDTKAPETQITDKPAGLVNVTTVSFSFTGDDSDGSGVASFQCRLDSEAPGAWEACTSAKQYSGLGEGSHKFEVRAVDQAGSPDATPASYQWQIDLTPPSVSVDSGPTGLTNDSTPTFGFSSEPGASFECSIDTGTPSFGSCSAASSHTPASPLSDGPHTFRVRATEQAGNQATATRSFTVDATEPTTQIADQPAALVNVATASFSFTGDDTGGSGVASFQCRIDSEAPGAWEACTSAKQYSGLGEGSHKFEVRALDNAGNADGSPAISSWQIDLTPPSVSVDSGPSGLTNDSTPTFGFGAEPSASLECSIDTGAPSYGPCSGANSHTPANPLADGPHTLRVRATDQAGNQATATRSFTVDATEPDTEITDKPASLVNVATASFSFAGDDAAGSGVASFQCRLDANAPEAWEACTSAKQYSGLGEGSHTFEVRAVDQAANPDTSPATYTWTVDTKAPETQITDKPAGLVNVATASFSFSGDDTGGSGVASFQCRLDSGAPEAWEACSSAKQYSGLGEGTHKFEVRAIDAAGNTDGTPASYEWSVDTKAPETQITAQPNVLVNSTSASFSFSGDDAGGSGIASFECRIDSEAAGAWGACTSAEQYADLSEGTHKFEVRAIDQIGNVDATPASYEWSVDSKAPDTQITDKPAALVNVATASFSFTGDDTGGSGVASFQCRIDSEAPEAWEACTSAKQYSSLGEGSHKFEVRAIDQASNADGTPASYTWQIDLTPPSVSVDSGPTGLTNDHTPTFGFGAEPSASLECSIDTGTPSFGPCSGANSHTPASPLADGPHTFRVRATDQAGNQAVATRSFTLDATEPETQITDKPASLVNVATASFAFAGEDPGGTGIASLECRLDSNAPGAWEACTSAKEYTDLADGSHTFEVRAIDQAVNTDATPASHEWTVDTKAPETQITDKPTALANVAIASFSFSGDDAGGSGIASFQCRLDSGAPEAWEACTSAKQYSGLGEGSHTFEVRATDQAGNTDETPASYEWSVDSKAPDTQITDKPAALVNVATASFSFTGDDTGGSGVASFQCRIDSEAPEAWEACTSAKQYSSLGEGSHKFEVRAIDQASNADGTPASYTWQIDLTPPSVSVDSGPTGLTNDHTPTFGFGAEPSASLECSIDTGTPSFGPCSGANSHTPASPLADGPHTFRVRATDQAGNQATATRSFTLDATEPETQITDKPLALVNVATASFAFAGEDPGGTGIASLECRLDSNAPGAWEACTSAKEYTDLADGSHTFEVRAIDQASNTDTTPAVYSWTVDTKAPETLIDTAPPAISNSATANFSFHGDDTGGSGLASLECRLDSNAPGAWEACTSAKEYTDLADGSHTFEVRAIDQASNTDTTPAVYSWTVDTKAPETLIDTAPPAISNSATANFSFHGDDTGGSGLASFECRLDSNAPGAWEACTSAKEYTDLADGSHTFEVRAIDQAVNTDATPASHEWTVDTKAPETQITDKPTALANVAIASFSFSGDDAGGSGIASFQCRLDSGAPEAWEACTSAKQYSGLGEGSHTFEVRATDQAGNTDETPASYEWSVDSKAPDTQITDKPAALVNVATASFSFTGDDTGGSGVASFQCRIDSEAPEAWEACTSAKQYSSLGEGSHKFEVRAIDQASNADGTPASYTWQIDLTPPSVSVDSGPTGLTNDHTPTFGFGAEPSASLECSIDTGTPSFGPCSGANSHTPASPLADGPHTFRVRATDQAGNQATATRSFTLDATEPETQITDKPASLVNVATASFSFTGNDPGGSGVASFQCRLDSEAPGAWASCATGQQYTGLSEGSHKFEVRAIDQAANADSTPATHQWQIDLSAPQVTIDPPAKALLKAGESTDLSWHADENGTFQLRLGGADCDAGTVIDSGSYGTSPAAKLSNVAAAQLQEGANTLRLCLTDAAGNRGQATTALNKDTGPPNTQITNQPTALVNVATASFSFTGDDVGGSGIASFQCRLDSGAPEAWEACTSAKQYSGLGEGSHAFEVRAIDQAGNPDASPATYTWTVDTKAPETQITDKPAALVNVATASFSFSGDDTGGSGVASFQCRIDSNAPEAWEACSSAKQYSSLGEGSHTFEVRSIDQASNADGTPATFSWQIDLTPPTVSVNSGPTGLTNDSTPTFGFGSEPGASLECSIDTGTPSFGACSGASSHTPASPLADGPHTFRVRATDQAGNQAIATRGFTVDTAAPQAPELSAMVPASPANDNTPQVVGSAPAGTTIRLYSGTVCSGSLIATVPAAQLEAGVEVSVADDSTASFSATATTPAENVSGCSEPLAYVEDSKAPETQITDKPAALVNSTSASFSFTGDDTGGSGVASFQCRIGSEAPEAWEACTSAKQYSSLGEGSHKFEVRAIDQASNADGTPASYTWQIDLTPPSVSVDSGPTGLTNDHTPTFGFGAEPSASLECSIDTGTPSFGPCSGANSHTPASPLADGPHTFRVRATDQAGNQAVATRSFTLDATEPETQITEKPAPLVNVPTASFSFNGDDVGGSGVAAFECRIDSNAPEAWEACSSAKQYSGLGEGSHAFEVRAIDQAGNTDTSAATYTWTVDTKAPETQITDKPVSLVSVANASFSFAGNDTGGSGVASFQCRIDSEAPEAWEACTSAKQYSSLGEGSHAFEVRAIDQAGNPDASPATYTWTVDTKAPETQITDKPAALVNVATASFSFTGDDTGGSGVASFQCRIDSNAPEAWEACSSAKQYSSLGEGSHTFEVRSIDQASNADGTPATFSWQIDLTPPTVSVNSGPTGLTNDSTPTFGFGSEPGASLECSIDTGTPSFGACSGASSHTPASPLSDGPHTFRVRATDQAGNQAIATRSFQVDTAAPQAPELDATIPASPANDNAPKVFGSAIADTTIRLYLGADCSGAPIATTSATGLENGIEVAVADNSTTSFSATATTPAENTSGCSEPLAYLEDSAAPDAQITDKPTGLVNVATASFSFSGDDTGGSGVASFQCRIDSSAPEAWEACTSAKQYAGLGEGSHTFEVRAIDQAGNQDATPASFDWTVDTKAPETQITDKPAGLVNVATASFSFSGDDAGGSGVASFQCRIDSEAPEAWEACTSAKQYSGLGEGSHKFAVRAIDQAGNADSTPATYEWSVDTTGPDTQITDKPAVLVSDTSASFSFTGDDTGSGVTSFECRIDSEAPEAWEACSLAKQYTGLSEGSHKFAVRAIDQAGNADSTPATYAWQIDLTPPVVSVDSGPTGLTNDSPPTFGFNSEPGAGFECSIDTGTPGFGPCSGANSHTPANPLADGPHTFRVRATDQAGNQAVATRSFTLDATEPITQITDKPAALVNVATASFSFTGDDASGSGVASFECRIDSNATEAWEACTSAKQYSGLGEGSHTFEVRAIDNAGNADGTPASYEWQIDLTPPTVSVNSGPTGLTNDSTPTFGFGSEPGASLECSIDTGTPSFGACSGASSHTPASPLADGPHTFRVRATDQAGNQAIATRGFTVDTAAPQAPELSAMVPASPANDNTPQVVGSAPAGTTIRLYSGTVCSGSLIATVPAAQLEAGVEVSVADDSTASFSATATTPAENVSGCSEPLAYVEDSKAPETQITDKPAALVNSTSASFSFTGDDTGGSGVASFQCRIDSEAPEAWEACTSAKQYSSLGEGSHKFEVRAIDQASNADGTPASYTWQIDLTPPSVSVDSGPTGLTNDHTPTFGFGAEPSAGFECSIDTGTPGFGPCSGANSHTPASPLADGPHTFRVRATDQAGNQAVATRSFTLDATEPTTQITDKPAALVNVATASFSFTGDDASGSGVASFECRIDSNATEAWESCASAKQYSGLGEGSHTFEVRAIDNAGNADGTPASYEWQIDLTPPTVSVNSGPSGLTNNHSPTFGFGSEPGASLECSIDTGTPSFGACSDANSHTPASPLADGPHTFRVRATDQAGNQAIATRGFTVDTAAPQAPELSAMVPASPANDNTPQVVGSAPAGTTIRLYSGTVCSGSLIATVPAAQLEAGVEVSVADDSTASFSATATTPAENVSGCSEPLAYVEDSKAPETQITDKPAALVNSTSASFSFTGDDTGGSGVASFQCRIGSEAPEAWEACTSAKQYSSLAEGSHKFEVRAIDQASNADGTPASYTWQIDLTPPTVSVDSGPTGLTNDHTPTFGFGAEPSAGFECSIDTGTPGFGPCSGANSHTPASPLADGPHTFRVRATDQAGNQAVATRSFTLDATEPTTQITDKPAALVNVATASFSFTGDDASGSGVASFECRIDSNATEAWESCASAKQYSGLGEGSHTFEVRAIDNAGNADGTPASYEWQIDLTPPTVSVNSGPTGLTNDSTPTFGFGSEPGASLECSIDTGTPSFGACSDANSHTPASPLADGPHTFRVRATDQAGNQAIATRGFTVDTAAPQAPELSATVPPSPANENNPEVVGSAPAGSTVRLYGNADCSGVPIAIDTAAALAAGIEVTVADNSTASFSATATSPADNTSDCSEPLAYVEDSAGPNTQITANPAALVNLSTASFSFTGDDTGGSGVASFECRIDSSAPGAWEVCSSTKQYADLVDGSHKFEVRAIDQAGNADATPASSNWTVDTKAPQTQITDSPAALVSSASANFSFSGDDTGGSGVAGFECRRDSEEPGDWAPCTSPRKDSSLAEGPHTFEVRAIDNAGSTDPTPASFEWSIDTKSPQTEITAQPPALANSTTASFSFAGDDSGGSGVTSFECRRDSIDPWQVCSSPRTYTGLSVGAHSFEVRAIDAAGNTDGTPAAYEWEIDANVPTAPQLSATVPASPANDNTPQVVGSAPAGTTVRLYSGADCSGATIATGTAAALAAGIEVTVADNSTTAFRATVTTAADNTSGCSEPLTYVEDSSAPQTQIDTGPAALANSTTASFSFSGDDSGGSGVASFQCRLDSNAPDAWAPCSSPSEYASLAEGGHAFEVRAVDQAGNAGSTPANRQWKVDLTPPSASVNSGPSGLTNDSTPTFGFGSEPGASFECSIDTGTPSFGPCSSAGSHTPASPLTDGPHTFRVRATDQAGNQAMATRGFTLDATDPGTQITGKPSTLAKVATASFSFDGDDSGSGVASFECRLDSTEPAAWEACTSPKAYADLADGPHGFEVRTIDNAGNADESPAAFQWTVDTTVPQDPADPNLAPPNSSPTPAGNPARFVRIRRNRKEGTARLVFEVPGPGELSVRAEAPEIAHIGAKSDARAAARIRQLKEQQRSVKPSSFEIAQAGQVEVPLQLTPLGKKLLQRDRMVKVKVVIRFKSVDGSLTTWKITITLKKDDTSLAKRKRQAK